MSSIAIYGPPGGGKSTMASTMCKLGYRIKWIDYDRKVRTMGNLKHLVDSGQIEVLEPKSKLLEGSLRQRVIAGPKKPLILQPKGYLELIDIINDLETNPPEDSLKWVIVLDSMTRVMEHMKRFILHIQNQASMRFEEWNFVLSNLEELFSCFFGLQPDTYAHVILICHDMTERDEIIGSIKTLPLIDGQMRNKVGSYVEEMYYCTVQTDKNGNPSFQALTKPMGTVNQARSSRDLATVVEPDFSLLFEGEEVRR